jgi:sortase B
MENTFTMTRAFQGRGKRMRIRRVKRRFWTLVLALSLCAATFAGVGIFGNLRMYGEAKQEYELLRAAASLLDRYAPAATEEDSYGRAPEEVADADAAASPSRADTQVLANINPDYVGWLEIDGTNVSYPMVQGEDNDKYLHTTFLGKENKLGAIFVDVRCEEPFDAPHTIVYGHNASSGNMFGGLSRLLGLREYPDVTVVLPDGETLVYRIFDVRRTDVRDVTFSSGLYDVPAFAAEIGAPEGAIRLLTLSTCTDEGGKDERLLVHAALMASPM